MARTPRATVSKTSGQGVSRLSYQKAYRAAHKGDTPSVKSSPTSATSGSTRDYSKSSKRTKNVDEGMFTANYGDTINPTDLKDVQELGKLTAMKPDVSVERQAKKLKKLK